MKFNAVCTNIPQYDPNAGGFTAEEKALGRKNIDAGGLGKYEIDAVEQWSGDLVLGQRTGASMREIGVKLRDAVSGDYKVGYLVPPRTFKGMNLVCDESGNITWGVQPPQLKSGNYTWIDDHYHINVSGLQEHLTFDYTEDQKISGVNGSAFYGGEGITYSAGEYIDITDENVINVTGLQPSGDYALNSDLSGKLDTSAYHEYSAGQYMSLNDYVFSVTGLQPSGDYATKDYVDSATSGKLDTSAYHEYSAGQYLSLNDYVFNVTGLQPELNFDYTDAGKISAINGSAVYGSEGGATYEAGQYININDQNVISVTGLQPSGNYLTPSDISGKLDTSAYEAPVQSDWTEDDNTLQSYILHKPVEIGLIAGSGVWFEDLTSAVRINCSATGGGSVSGGGTSGYYTDLGGTAYFEDEFTFTHDGHFGMGSMEKAMVPVSNLSTDEGKVPVIYVRDGRSYYLLERIIPAYTSAN